MTITRFFTTDGVNRAYVGCAVRVGRKVYCNVTAEWLFAHGFKRVVEEEVPQEELPQCVDSFVLYEDYNETFWVHYVSAPEIIDLEEPENP